MKREVKKLEGWITFGEAAELFKVTKQGFFKMVDEQGMFRNEDLRRVGDVSAYLIRAETAQAAAADRAKMKNLKKKIDSSEI